MAGKKKLGGVEETNRRLGRIESTLTTASKVFELMHERLEHLEQGQQALVEGQQALVEGQQALVEGQRALVQGQRAFVDGQQRVIERLDRLVEASMRDRTAWAERYGRIEERIERLESAVFPPGPPR